MAASRSIALLLLISVSLLLCGGSEAAWSDGDDGVDRRNGDLPGYPIPLASGAAPSVCAAKCAAEEKCQAWAYGKADCDTAHGNNDVGVHGKHRPGTVKDSSPMCWLKGSITPQSLDKCRVCDINKTE